MQNYQESCEWGQWGEQLCAAGTQCSSTGGTWIQEPVLFAPSYSCINLGIATTPHPGSEQQLCWDRAATASWSMWYHCCIPLLAAGLPHSATRPFTNRSKMLMGEGGKNKRIQKKVLGQDGGGAMAPRGSSAMQEQCRRGGPSHGTAWPGSASAHITVDRLCSDQARHLPTSLP